MIELAISLPALGAIGVLVAHRSPGARDAVTLLAALATFGCVVSLVPAVVAGDRPTTCLLDVLPGASLAFTLEPLGMLFALVASGLWIPTAVYAIGYMRAENEKHLTRFFACFALAIFAALGVAFAGNLFTLFLFYEILTFTTYPLVVHKGTDEARAGGRVYLGVLVFTSISLLLFGVLAVYALTGTLEFRDGGILGDVSPALLPWLLALFAFGTGKAALMPFHRWLPAAMVAPTPVSALLHAVAVVKAGVFTVLKVVVYIFGIERLSATGASTWLMAVAAFTMLAAAVRALALDDLKARLAYSTVSQLAYIVLGAALATGTSVVGGGLHIAMHAVGKITLFFCAGAIYVAAHKTKVSQLDGIGRRMPFTMGAFLLGSLAIVGVPPFGGAWSKWFLGVGAAEGGNALYVGAYMLGSLLSVGYLMPIVIRAFFRPQAEGDTADHGEAPPLCVVPLCATAVGCILLFLFADALLTLLAPLAGGTS